MLLVITAILVLFLVSLTSYEHMTNKDMLSAIKTYGTEDTAKSKKKSGQPLEAPIYGPKVEPIEHPTPANSSSKTNGGSNIYPDIYGPDVVASPGEKVKSAKHESDNAEDDYNPDLQKAFPTSGPPQPFLANFSKFQH